MTDITLFQRLANVGLPESSALPEEQRIRLHGFKTMVHWAEKTVADPAQRIPFLTNHYSMTMSQAADLVRIFTAYAALAVPGDDNATAIAQARFLREVFDFLVGAEIGLLPDFSVEANFWSFIGA